jgi:glycosyltransferase involved in cell wall biosynthesis
VVLSRGVPADFCASTPPTDCDAAPAVRIMRRRPTGALAFVYVGRLSYDKSVDELMLAFERARAGGRAAGAVLYLAGSGELEAHIPAHVTRIARGRGRGGEAKGARNVSADEGTGSGGRSEGGRGGNGRGASPGGLSIVHLGQVSRKYVPCVLREADAYVSAAHNETYGRSLVEALRCGLPVLTMRGCNMHVEHQGNGLLGEDGDDLSRNIRLVAEEEAVRAALSAGALAYDGGTDGGMAPNDAMLRAVLDAHVASREQGRRARAWHPFWSIWMGLSVVLDQPR